MSSTKSQVAIATSISNLSTSQSQKDYNCEESLGRQNSFGNSRRGNMKGKHLTRSHAMRESTSPPRTPTPRTENAPISPNGQGSGYPNNMYQQYHDANDNISNNNNNKLHTQSIINRGNSPITDTPVVIVTSQLKQQQQQNVAALCNETEFPKLTPPKSNKLTNGSTTNSTSVTTSGGNGNVGAVCGGNGMGGYGVNAQQHQVRNTTVLTNGGGSNSIAENKSECIVKANFNNNNNCNVNNSNNHSNTNSNNIGNSNAYKKQVVDLKSNVNISTPEQQTQKNSNNTNKPNAQMQQPHKVGHGLHQTLNIVENQQIQHQTPQQIQQITSHSPSPMGGTVYNSPLNYQLSDDTAPQQSQQHNSYEKDNCCPRNESQSSNMSTSYEEDSQHNYERHVIGNSNSGGGGGGASHGGSSCGAGGGSSMGSGNGNNNSNKKNRTSNSKGTKPRLKHIGGSSSGSLDTSSNSNNTSGFISRENSSEQFTDYGGTDLLSFFKETLNRTSKDRIFLLKTEKELIELVQDKSRSEYRFPANSSYNRMLLHRTAAFFGMEHNVDSESQQCVIVNVTKNTRIPDIRFKSLIRDHREDTRKSILKRDTHSFDEPRQSSYLCPDRGMLDRKAKSFEEREEDYERVRNRIFSRAINDGGDSPDENVSNINWSATMDQQSKQHQSQQRNRNQTGKMTKMQNVNDNRDSRSGSVSKAHNFVGYNGSPTLRGDQINSTKNTNTRTYSKQDSTNSNSSQWRLSPLNTASIYHFDPSNLPPSQPIATSTYQSSQSVNYSPHHQQNSQLKNKTKSQQSKNAQHNELPKGVSSTSNASDEEPGLPITDLAAVNDPLEVATQEIELDHEAGGDVTNYTENGKTVTVEAATQLSIDECDNIGESCLSVTTTTHTKNYDRIEIQKFKHQATSPNIPSDRDEPNNRENLLHSDGSETREQTPSHNQEAGGQTPTGDPNTKPNTTVSEDPKTTTWTYTTSYQAPDGSTVFHTTTTPNGSPYCTTTYQQAPDGSIYAVPQGMVYAYPQQVEGEVQGFLMPVFEANAQRSDAGTLIPAGTQTIYPANGSTATVVPIATAYPTAQFASAATPIYPAGQLIYASDQFATSGATLTTAAPPSNGQLQQIPMTYPIGYPYPYNGGYWGQNITYYVPQQTIGTTVAATPLLPAPTQVPPPTPGSAGTMTGAHVPGGVTITNITPTAAGPSSNSQMSLTSSNVGISNANSHTTYQALSGTAYFGTGRIKQPNASHFASTQQSGHHQIVATIPGTGGATATYQLGHAVPTLTLATAGNAVNGTNDLNGSNTQAATPMYTLPQHATIFPANLYSYAPSGGSTTPGPAQQSHTSGNTITPTAISSCVPSHGTTHLPHNSTVISNPPFYATHPQVHAPAAAPAMHTPGPAAIPIVDPATLNTAQVASNGSITTYGAQSTPTTPHSISTQIIRQRNPPLFSTPPIVSSSGSMYTNSSSSHYYGHATNVENQQSTGVTLINSPQTSCGISNYDKRSNSSNAKKSSTYNAHNSSMVRHIPTNNYMPHNSISKPSLLSAVETPRASPNTGYHNQNQRTHLINKRNNDKPAQQASLMSGQYTGTSSNTSNYHTTVNHSNSTMDTPTNKPPIRLNAAAASFRQKSSSNVGGGDYRRSISQRNSPATNSSSNDTSNNNSPNSIAGTSSNSAATTPNTPLGTFITNGTLYNNHSNEAHQAQATSALYIQRGSYIPATIQQNNNLSAGGNVATGSQQPNTVLSNTVAATATIGTYNPAAASGVYFKYGQTYFAHPSVALPNSRRSPSTDIRPPMAQMAGMYPTVNMMIPAPTRHAQGRNPNYRGTRPPR